MYCKAAREFITLYIDGMLDEANTRDVEAHLKECPECCSRFREIKEIVTLVGELGEEDLPDGFSKRLRMRLEAQQTNGVIHKKTGKPYYWVKWVGMATAVAVIVLSVRLLGVLDLQDKTVQDLDSKAKSGSMESMNQQDTNKGMPENGKLGDELTGYGQEPTEEAEEQDNQVISEEEGEATESMGEKGGTSQEVNIDVPLKENEDEQAIDSISSDIVELRVQDICITSQTLMTKALQHGINVLDISEKDITLQFTDEEQRRTLYKELKMLGTVRDIGKDFNTDTVSIIIVHDE